ncbi:MAG: hypothetical protein M3Z22_07325 [Verrucomicrobiota bacterium]|nr:hypothetical protein [Verrucomicrobiota bacterium]
MRIVIGLLIACAVAGGIAAHRHGEQTAKATPVTTLSPRPASEHDWAKSALDRTAEVKRQIAERKQNQVP